MRFEDLPGEVFLAVVLRGIDDVHTLLSFAATCKNVCRAVWPTYNLLRENLLKTDGKRFNELLKDKRLIVKVALDEEEDSDREDDDDLPMNPFYMAYARVTMYLDAQDEQTHKLLRSFLRCVQSIDTLILDFGGGADIANAMAIINLAAQIPDVDLNIRGGERSLINHNDRHSGPFTPFGHAPRRPCSVDLALSCVPQMSSLIIETDALFLSSMYPVTHQLLTLAPLTSLSVHDLVLDAFNWSKILPALTLPHLEQLTLAGLEIAAEHLIQFLARHTHITLLDLSQTPAIAMRLRFLKELDLPQLHTLRADPSFLIPLLQHHLMGRLQALRTVGITFPARMKQILRSMPKDLPPELDDFAFRDLEDFETVYASLNRCTLLTLLELEHLRHSGFVEWVMAQKNKFKPFQGIQEVVLKDGELLIRRGSVLRLAFWMSKRYQSPTLDKIRKYSLPEEVAVDEMVRKFLTDVFPDMVRLQYRMNQPTGPLWFQIANGR